MYESAIYDWYLSSHWEAQLIHIPLKVWVGGKEIWEDIEESVEAVLVIVSPVLGARPICMISARQLDPLQ